MILLLLLTVTAAVPAAAQPFDIEIKNDQEPVPQGGEKKLTVEVTNKGSAPASARWLQRFSVSTVAGALIRAVVNSDPVVACVRQGIFAGNEIWDCFCDPNTPIPAGGKNISDVWVGIPLTATLGTTIRFETSLSFANALAGRLSTFITVGSAAAPRLEIKIIRADLGYDKKMQTLFVDYAFNVKNVGSAPTTGPIDVDISYAAPGGVEMTVQPGNANWSPAGSVLRHRILQILQVEQTYYAPVLPLRSTPQSLRYFARGRYEITALAAGGGSPPDQKKDDFTPDDFWPRSLGVGVLEDVDPLAEVFGRPR